MLRKYTKIKTGDTVRMISGKDKGKQGKVTQVFPDYQKVVVEGLNIAKRHLRGRKQGEPGQVVEFASPVPADKVQLVCPKCGKVSRVGYVFDEEKHKTRICRKCNASI